MKNKVLIGDTISNIGKLVAKTLAYAGVETIICDNCYAELKHNIMSEDPDMIICYGLKGKESPNDLIDFINDHKPNMKIIMLFFDVLLENSIKQKYGESIRTILLPESTAYISRTAIKYLNFRKRMPLFIEIIDFMSAMGFTKMLAGFFYIAIAVEEICRDSELLDNINQSLYPRIAERANTSSENIERSIRHYICRSRINSEVFARIGCSPNPTNSSLILSMYKRFKAEHDDGGD